MRAYSLTHVGDGRLLRGLAVLVAKERNHTAQLLAHMAEVDSRRLYAPAGYPSMYEYCIRELRLSEDAAYRRIRAARVARQFPALFSAIASGKLNLSGISLLAPYLTPANAGELIAAAAGRTKDEVDQLLAERFPRPAVSAVLAEVPITRVRQLVPGRVGTPGPAPASAAPTRPVVRPLAPRRFALQATIDQKTHDNLRYARQLLSHRMPAGDLAAVLGLALEALVEKLEKRKFAACAKPRKGAQATASNARTIPAHVKRAVWERDHGQCTFIAENGRRCTSKALLEFDHIEPVARGGRCTIENLRLRCRAHNQHEAACHFGAGFMHEKRERARQARESAADRDVMAALCTLGYRKGEARRAAQFSSESPGGTLEERVRLALSWFRPKQVSRTALRL